MDWQNKKILVTGGAGLIGSNLVRRLIEKGSDVFVVDNLWRGQKENLSDEGKPLIDMDKRFFAYDLRDYSLCLDVVRGVDLVYHLADVVAGINYTFANQSFLFRSNILINSNTLNAAIENKVKNFIYVGTACSYPADKQAVLNPPPFKEEEVYPANPESSYGWSKLIGEYECELAQKESFINVGILRFHNVYGPPCEISPEKSQVIPSLCRKAIRYPEENFIVWGSGEQRRAFVYVDDVVDALMAVSDKGMNQGAIQIGLEKSTSIREIAKTIIEISGKKINVHYDTSKPEGDKDRAADWSKARKLLGWSPHTDLREGLEKTYNWCKDKILSQSIN